MLQHFVNLKRKVFDQIDSYASESKNDSWKRGFSTRLPFAIEHLEGRVLLSATVGVPTEVPLEVIAVEMSPIVTSQVGEDGEVPEFIGDRIFNTSDTPEVEIIFDSLFEITDQVDLLGAEVVSGIEDTVLDNYVGYVLGDLLEVAAIDLETIFSLGDVINLFINRNNPFDVLPASYPVDLRDLQNFLDNEWLRDIPGPANILNLSDTTTTYNLEFSSVFDLPFSVLLEPKKFEGELSPIELDMEIVGEIAFQLVFEKETGLVSWKQDALFLEISWDQEFLGQFAYYQYLRERFTTAEVTEFLERQRSIVERFTPEYVQFLRDNPFARVPGYLYERLSSFPLYGDVEFVEGMDFEYPKIEQSLTVELEDDPGDNPEGGSVIPPIFAFSNPYYAASGLGLHAYHLKRSAWWEQFLQDKEDEEKEDDTSSDDRSVEIPQS